MQKWLTKWWESVFWKKKIHTGQPLRVKKKKNQKEKKKTKTNNYTIKQPLEEYANFLCLAVFFNRI